MKEIMVSVFCTVYNHEKYLRKCLQGFVEQKTDFGVEYLVHDDCSTDNSVSIIKEFADNYPDIIKPIYETENQYSKGIHISRDILLPMAKGKYIALCEGDDYWTNCYKLQKQYDAMELNDSIDICAHSALMINAKNKKANKIIAPKNENDIIDVAEVIEGGGLYVATNSLMYRKSITKNEPEFRRFLSFDYSLQIYGALRGGMLYINECMSVYNYQTNNSWTDSMTHDKQRYKKHYEKEQKMLDMVDEYTEGKYHFAIENRKLNFEYSYLLTTKQYKRCFEEKYKSIRKSFGIKHIVHLWLNAYIPGFDFFYHKIKHN